MSRIDARFAALAREGRAGLVTFVTAGDPDYATSLAILRGLPAAGADVVELGMPFTDPMADGPAIQASSLRALNAQPVVARNTAVVSAPTASLSLQSANDYAPSVEISENYGDEPIVVETLFARPEGKMVTRHSQVVRQGDKILSIMKPRLREWNVSTDIHDEADLTN